MKETESIKRVSGCKVRLLKMRSQEKLVKKREIFVEHEVRWAYSKVPVNSQRISQIEMDRRYET